MTAPDPQTWPAPPSGNFSPAPMPPVPMPVERTWPLDAAVAGDTTGPAWGARPVLVPIATFAVLIVAGQLLTHTVHLHSPDQRLWASVLLNAAIVVLLAVGVWLGGRKVAAGHGGWAVFGWRRPRAHDLAVAAAGFAAALGARLVVGMVMAAVSHGRAAAQAQNLHVHHVSWAGAVLLLVVVAGCAPVLEELTFRGLILRTFMRRVGFVPAAVASTSIFALFHVYEAATVLGAVTLALSVATIGATNCVLVRYTDRLAAGIYVHAALNAIAVGVTLAAASR